MNLIYRLEFNSGATYIGSTTNLSDRLCVFRHNRPGAHSRALHAAITADPSFKVVVVACALDASTMHEVEAAVIAQERASLNIARPEPNRAAPPKPKQMRERIIEGKTINQWAKELAVGANVLHARLHAGWTEREVVGLAPRASMLRVRAKREREAQAVIRRGDRLMRKALREAKELSEAAELEAWQDRTGIRLQVG